MKNPPLALLHEYYQKYQEWSKVWESAAPPLLTEQHRQKLQSDKEKMRFVVASVTGGGLGNQLQQAVQGLIVALATDRPLIIHAVHTREEAARHGMQWHNNLEQRYTFNATLPLLDMDVLDELGFQTERHPLESWGDPHTLDVHLHSEQGRQFMVWDACNTCRLAAQHECA